MKALCARFSVQSSFRKKFSKLHAYGPVSLSGILTLKERGYIYKLKSKGCSICER